MIESKSTDFKLVRLQQATQHCADKFLSVFVSHQGIYKKGDPACSLRPPGTIQINLLDLGAHGKKDTKYFDIEPRASSQRKRSTCAETIIS